MPRTDDPDAAGHDRGAVDWQPLVAAALAARERAHAPYSRFRVGAALRAADGTLHAGANVENRSYGLTVCAERVAVVAAVAAGAVGIRAIAIATAEDPPAPPCGLCLQTLAEFAGPDLPVLLVNPAGARRELRLGDLLPHPFAPPRG